VIAVPQPHWTVPVNFRAQDRSVLDAALNIAKNEGSDVTSVFRTALSEFVGRKNLQHEGPKLDKFIRDSVMPEPIFNKVLTPKILGLWSESDLLSAAKKVRSRKWELDCELRLRGFDFDW